jgi:hypothetical protein
MIFASDLDRTLIYSRQFCEQYPSAASQLQLIEEHEGRELSVMSQAAMIKLEKIGEMMMFVPVTTRTLEQYNRIRLFHKKVPHYAIINNGGMVLIKGNVDSNWQKKLQIKLLAECMPMREIWEFFHKTLNGPWISVARQADGLFCYFIVDQAKIPAENLYNFAQKIVNWGWELILQGRKLYLIPKVVNKGDALKYVKDMSGRNLIVAAGDSQLDVCMLKVADYPIIPRHGELWPHFGRSIKSTEQAGVLAAEEILDYAQLIYSTVISKNQEIALRS